MEEMEEENLEEGKVQEAMQSPSPLCKTKEVVGITSKDSFDMDIPEELPFSEESCSQISIPIEALP